jgi:hypothetical protein
LNFACHELKVFGDHLTLAKKIESLPSIFNGLIKEIFIRFDKESENNLVKKVI